MTCRYSKKDFESLRTRREIPQEQFEACNITPNSADYMRFTTAPGFRAVNKQIQKEQQAQFTQMGLVIGVVVGVTWLVYSLRKSNASKQPTDQ